MTRRDTASSDDQAALRATETAISGTANALTAPRAAHMSESTTWNSMALLYM